ncbi:MAG: hypothetical protein HY010_18635 [Acidobacteria bacterium]|nr:hypothetical protein [Acidobacteriota bacterium]
MNSKALYWIALGIFALALNSEYRLGNLPLANRVVGRAEGVLCQVATKAEQTLAVAKLLIGQQDLPSSDSFSALQQAEVERVLAEHQAEVERAMALRQANMDRIQQKLDRVQLVMDRSQVKKLRVLQRTRFKFSNVNTQHFVFCPHTGTRVTVNSGPEVVVGVDVDDPQVDTQ